MTWKQRARRALDHPVAGIPARAAFTALATAQLARAARHDRRTVGLPTPEQRADTAEHVTIAVKTFMRPATCRRFIRSARTWCLCRSTPGSPWGATSPSRWWTPSSRW
ncbi:MULTISPECIES: hypothetical protein [Kytococcus]|uniref:Uncharacterized protein n=1 Tax=Kytococcus schroeteri TaxID=138300 RepID=A0A2I1PAG3_9MICO|nr:MULTISPECIES: hypothetical protein [Kytococcus]OFS15443.1 hypothetical protein HMPREF3099_02105 [Kytococcus sp. HMSC28H12]PKZ41610.1 hypothetical protein CYJ76_06950 [Kytococcus schroeteri]